MQAVGASSEVLILAVDYETTEAWITLVSRSYVVLLYVIRPRCPVCHLGNFTIGKAGNLPDKFGR